VADENSWRRSKRQHLPAASRRTSFGCSTATMSRAHQLTAKKGDYQSISCDVPPRSHLATPRFRNFNPAPARADAIAMVQWSRPPHRSLPNQSHPYRALGSSSCRRGLAPEASDDIRGLCISARRAVHPRLRASPSQWSARCSNRNLRLKRAAFIRNQSWFKGRPLRRPCAPQLSEGAHVTDPGGIRNTEL
jgi:hypothetical protein